VAGLFELDRLIADLRSQPPLARAEHEMAELLRAVCFSGLSFKRPLPCRDAAYTRTRAYGNDGFEVLLLNWAPGAASPIHDHGGQHCWLAVLDGSLVVDNYERLDSGERQNCALIASRGSAALDCGDLDLRSGRFDIHRVRASRASSALTLHVYAGPLRRFLVYDELAQRCQVANGVYDASL
jgi:predicted metal-dependent enzyme (double-stranded beta helix superfamily)